MKKKQEPRTLIEGTSWMKKKQEPRTLIDCNKINDPRMYDLLIELFNKKKEQLICKKMMKTHKLYEVTISRIETHYVFAKNKSLAQKQAINSCSTNSSPIHQTLCETKIITSKDQLKGLAKEMPVFHVDNEEEELITIEEILKGK